jgi:hypothetical protein
LSFLPPTEKQKETCYSPYSGGEGAHIYHLDQRSELKSKIVTMANWLLKKIVHNDAMDTDPAEIYGWRVYLLACSVSTPR